MKFLNPVLPMMALLVYFTVTKWNKFFANYQRKGDFICSVNVRFQSVDGFLKYLTLGKTLERNH